MAFFRTNDQLSLYFKATTAESSKASIVFVHGVGEHIGRYAETFQAFSAQGYSCFG
ncbi:MAG: serine aminopeptidase domain-containing protein, partial [Mucilaginibacter sp.]